LLLSPSHSAAGRCRASDKCQREKRKTINGDDLLWAMSTLGFEDYIEPLKLYLHKYREVRRRLACTCVC
jgi:Histone-like transcription factor (CBF/NF-Y) and archaeal histone